MSLRSELCYHPPMKPQRDALVGTRETALETATLEIDQVEALVKCSHCAYEGSPQYWADALSGTAIPTLQCPQCGRAAEPFQGHECSIKGIWYVA